MASVSELTCIYSALILHDDEVTVTALANVNIGSLLCSVGAGGPAPAAGASPAGGPAPLLPTAAAPAEKKVEAKKEESEESNDDMGFGVFD
ncbi:PREDICTED: 60S acidic ribosomal protein P1-like [Elephantulus edwardii]|uniref:60S acidic ribosomal protein P1-like n=1 Tax=Elephantulus edwardii TaxID=28737 RepID=UPI0003F069E0|nr:PREDICTED: 60S acidic ribosomal protein P1-like [Elephantulus edwardii]